MIDRRQENRRTIGRFVAPTAGAMLCAILSAAGFAARADEPPAPVAGSVLVSHIDGAAPDTSSPFADPSQYLIRGESLHQPGFPTLPVATSVFSLPAAGGQVGAVASLSPFPIGVKVGALLSPVTKFYAGADVEFPQARIWGLTPRVDFDAIVAANFGGVDTLFDFTVGLVYAHAMPLGTQFYVGGGIGPYFSDQTRLGGKVILGYMFTRRFGVEGNVVFPGAGDTGFTLALRMGL